MTTRRALKPLGAEEKEPFDPGTVLFESSKPGTYYLDVPKAKNIEIETDGSGGGGGGLWAGHANFPGGGSGAAVVAIYNFKSKIRLKIVIGKGGNPNGATGNTGTDGGDTYVEPLAYKAGGGKKGGWNGFGGAGGVVTRINNDLTPKVTFQSNGNKARDGHTLGVNPGGASVHEGHGEGGAGPSGTGGNGYVKITYLGKAAK